MIALIERHRIAYVGIPKCGTTTFLKLAYLLDHGRPFKDGHAGTHVHRYYRGLAAERGIELHPPDPAALNGYWRFAVVRNPVRRLISAYSHRVLKLGEIASNWDRAKPDRRREFERDRIVRDPSPEEFFDKLDLYRKHFRSIRHHTDPMSRFLGPDLSAYHFVAQLEDMAPLQKQLRQRTGAKIDLPVTHAVPPAIGFDQLSAGTQSKVRDFLKPDFALLGPLYAEAVS